jgi:hypothetical protein
VSRSIACTLLVLSLGCSVYTDGLGTPADAGRSDGTPPADTGTGDRDAGTDDAGAQDAGAQDAGVEDAGVEDAGFDAGPTGALRTVRWELRCGRTSGSSDHLCETANRADDAATMAGAPGRLYDVTIRVRGVTEMKTVDGGRWDPPFHVGGTARYDDWTEAGLTVSDPSGQYWLNSGSSGSDTCVGLDYERTIRIREGATVTVWGATRNDWSNRNFDDEGDPIVIDGVRPAPDPFDGQFIQVDAVAITEALP